VSTARLFGASALGTFLLIAGAGAAVFVPLRAWREDRAVFDPATGAFVSAAGEVGPECPPVDAEEISCEVLGPGEWLWWNGTSTAAVHYPSARTLPPAPGKRYTYTPAGDGAIAAVCVGRSGRAGAWVEVENGWLRVADTGPFDAFVREEPKPASTPAGLVAARKNELYVWRPGDPVRTVRSSWGEQNIYGLTPGPGALVSVASVVDAVDPGQAALKVVGLCAAVAALFLFRRLRKQRPRARVVVAGVLLGLVVIAAIVAAGVLYVVGAAMGVH
jgi:hypothetical protein